MNGEHEWSDSGLRCLQNIQIEIERHGGAEKMYFKILEETAENKYIRYRSRLSDNVRTLKRSNVRAEVIMDVLMITKTELDKIIRELSTGDNF